MKSLIFSASMAAALVALGAHEGRATKLHLVRPIASQLNQKLSHTSDKLWLGATQLASRSQSYMEETGTTAKRRAYGAAHLAKTGTQRGLTNFRNDPKRALKGVGEAAYRYKYPIAYSAIIGGKMAILPILLGQPVSAHEHDGGGGGFWGFLASIPDRIDNAFDGNCYDGAGQWVCDHHGGDHHGGNHHSYHHKDHDYDHKDHDYDHKDHDDDDHDDDHSDRGGSEKRHRNDD